MRENTDLLIQLLIGELGVTFNSIAVVPQHCDQSPHLMAIVLWQYGSTRLYELE